jgi:hypothetical protein
MTFCIDEVVAQFDSIAGDMRHAVHSITKSRY